MGMEYDPNTWSRPTSVPPTSNERRPSSYFDATTRPVG